MKEFEVEIDGVLFKVKQIVPEEETAEYDEKEAELIARACLEFEDEAEKKTAVKTSEKKIVHETETEKITEVFRDKVTEKFVGGKMESLRKNQTETSDAAVNYRRQVEELSRYLSRDSRRYDGNFEIY